MRKFSLLMIVFSFQLGVRCVAQTMVLHDDRSKDSAISRFGPNMARHVSLIIGGGLAASSDREGGRIRYGSSGEIIVGIREKYKISALYSMGVELTSRSEYYKLKNEEGKILPDSIMHDVERMDVSTIGLSYYSRFNFDPRRGNYLGNYLDIGIHGGWIIEMDHTTKDRLPDGSKIKDTQSKLPYSNKFSYDLVARLGRSHAALYVHYRLSDLFKSRYNYPELPRLMAGLELGIFK